MSKNLLVHWVARLLNEKAYVFLARRHQPLKHTISSKPRDRKWGIFSLCTSSLLTLYTLPCVAPDERTFQFIGRTTSKRHLPSGKSYYIHSSSCSEHYIKDNCLCWFCCWLLFWFGFFFARTSSTSLWIKVSKYVDVSILIRDRSILLKQISCASLLSCLDLHLEQATSWSVLGMPQTWCSLGACWFASTTAQWHSACETSLQLF